MNLTSLKVGWFLAVRQIKRSSKGTTLLIIFIMTLTFLNLVVVNGILVGLLQGSFNQFRERYSGDILITPQDRLNNIDYSQKLINLIEGQKGVVAVSPRLTLNGQIKGDLSKNPTGKESPNQSSGSIVGIDPAAENKVTGVSDLILQGQPLRAGDEGYIIVGASLIKEYSAFADANFPGLTILSGIKVGDKVRVSFKIQSAQGVTEVSKDVIVKGIIKSKVDQVSQRSFMLASEMRKMVSDTDLNVQEIAVKVNSENTDEVYQAIINGVDLTKVRVQKSADAVPSFLRNIKDTFDILGNVIGSIALVVASITVFIVIFINAVTRRKYIGILKGIGIRSSAIQIAYLFQALFYGFLGSLIGFITVFWFLVPFFNEHPLDFPFSDGILAATLSGALIRAGLLLFITLCAGFIPAWLIVRKNTLDSILGR